MGYLLEVTAGGGGGCSERGDITDKSGQEKYASVCPLTPREFTEATIGLFLGEKVLERGSR